MMNYNEDIRVVGYNSLYKEQLADLLGAYKTEIGEEPISDVDFANLEQAIDEKRIRFFLAVDKNNYMKTVGVVSVTTNFSTFRCGEIAVLEDFFVLPEYREKGVGRCLATSVFEFCAKNAIVSITVACADCDVEMYKSLGFENRLGNLLCSTSC